MRLTEHELTEAPAGAVKAGLRRPGRRSVDDVWATMDRYRRYQLLDRLGTQVLPVLAALPDVDVPTGGRPVLTDREVATVIEQLLDAGSDSGGGGRLRRAVTVRTRTSLVQLALAHVPPRLDPDDERSTTAGG